MMDKNKLTEFLTNLATNDGLARAFKENKKATMKAHGLSEEQIDLVINKQYDQIQNILGADYTIANNDIVRAYKKD